MSFTAFLNWKFPEELDLHREAVCTIQLELTDLPAKPFYAKFYDQAKQPRGLVNEVIGYCVARSWGFDVPEHAAVAFLPLRKLKLSNCPVSARWLRVAAKTTEVYPAFCTSIVNGSPPAMTLGPDWDIVRQDIALWQRLPAAVALDHIIGNTDRHLGNLLRLSKARYALIDHGRLFSEQSANWNHKDLSASGTYKNRLAELMVGTVADLGNQVVQAAAEHAQFSDEGLHALPSWISEFASQSDVQHVRSVIKARALNSCTALPLEMGNLC